MQPFGSPMARLLRAGSPTTFLRHDGHVWTSRALRSASSRPGRPALDQICRHRFSSHPRCCLPRNVAKDASLPSGDTTSAASASAEEPPRPPPTGEARAKSELPSETDSRRSDFNQKFSHVMDNVQARMLTASQTLNDMTGYSAIEAIKKDNDDMELRLSEAHNRVRAARQAYKSSNTKRATTQREVTTLLARKDTWSPSDLERFTELYRADHVLEGEVSAAQEALTEAEADEQSLSQRLNAGILKRYHEEQIWSDRIRRASTWGTWGLMGMNFLLFVVLQFFAEPWRRRRLVNGVVEEEKRLLDQVRGELEAVKLSFAKQEETSISAQESVPNATIVEAEAPSMTHVPVGWRDVVMDPTRWRLFAADLYSDRRIDLRMKDASMLALQGAMSGALVAGCMAMLLKRGS